MDGCLWMHMYIAGLELDFMDRLEWDKGFRLELVLGDGTRVVCFFLETWVLSVLSLFYIWTAYPIHHLQVVSYVQFTIFLICESFIPGGSDGKVPARNVGPWFNPWDGKIPWRRKWQPTPVSCLENSTDGGTWWATVHGVAKSRTRLSNFTLLVVGTVRFVF